MNFSAPNASRKWPCRAIGGGRAAMVTVAVLIALIAGGSTVDAGVPLPQPRPAEAPGPADSAASPNDGKAVDQPPPPAAAEPAPASACRLALTDAIAIAPSIPPITGPGACGGDDLVRLEAVVLPDKQRVALKPAAILRCSMATAIANWIRADMAPLATGLGSSIADLDNFDSFECRGRNRVAGAKLSEHGRANALDVRDLKLASGQLIGLTDRGTDRAVRETVLQSVCARFTTVLGPGSDGYHEDHIHLDLAERHNGYRICQWNLYDALPPVAPLLPEPRPVEAPSREVASVPPAAVAPEPSASNPSANEPSANKPSGNELPASGLALGKGVASAPVASPLNAAAAPPAGLKSDTVPLPRPAPADRPPPPKASRRAAVVPSSPQAIAPQVITPQASRGKAAKSRHSRRRSPGLPPFLRMFLH